MPDVDPNLGAADQGSPAPGLLAALQPGGTYRAPADLRAPAGQTQDTPYDQAVRASGQTPTTPPAKGGPPDHLVTPIPPDLQGLDPAVKKIYTGESGSPAGDYRARYGFPDLPGAPGPAGESHALGAGQWQPGTWKQAAREVQQKYGITPDFNKPEDQDLVTKYWAKKRYAELSGGRDLAADIKSNSVNWGILSPEWTSLGPHGPSGSSAALQIGEDSRRARESSISSFERDRQRYLDEAAKAPPGSAERMEMLHEAHQHAQELTKLYEEQMRSPPQRQPLDVFAGWGGIVLALAAFAGRRSAQPLTASLNAMSGAMDAMAQGNERDFQDRFKIWGKQTDYALKAVELQHQDMREILDDQRLSEAEKQAHLSTLYHEFGMDQEIAAQRSGRVEDQYKLWERNEKLTLEARNKVADIYKFQYEKADSDYRAALTAAQGDFDDPNVKAAKAKQESAFGDWQRAVTGQPPAGGPPDTATPTVTPPGTREAQADQTTPPATATPGIGHPRSMAAAESKLLQNEIKRYQGEHGGQMPTDAEMAKMIADIKRLGQPPSASQQRAEEKRADAADAVDSTITLIDATAPLISTASTGFGGEASKIAQGIVGTVGIDLKTQQAKFAQHAELVQAQIRNELIKSHYMSRGAIEQLDEIVPGLGLLDDPVTVKQRWDSLRTLLVGERNRLRNLPGAGPAIEGSGSQDDPYHPTAGQLDSLKPGDFYVHPDDPANLRQKK